MAKISPNLKIKNLVYTLAAKKFSWDAKFRFHVNMLKNVGGVAIRSLGFKIEQKAQTRIGRGGTSSLKDWKYNWFCENFEVFWPYNSLFWDTIKLKLYGENVLFDNTTSTTNP